MEHLLQQLNALPEAAELARRVEAGGCPAAVSGLALVRDMLGAASAGWLWLVPFPVYFGGAWFFLARGWSRR